MTGPLAGSRLLVVEDEYYLADDTRSVLSNVGVHVVGPMATLEEAEAFLRAGAAVDGVLLDLNLRGTLAFGMADALQSRGIPFAFMTGYDCAALPDRFAQVPKLQKPASSDELIRVATKLAAVRHRSAAG